MDLIDHASQNLWLFSRVFGVFSRVSRTESVMNVHSTLLASFIAECENGCAGQNVASYAAGVASSKKTFTMGSATPPLAGTAWHSTCTHGYNKENKIRT